MLCKKKKMEELTEHGCNGAHLLLNFKRSHFRAPEFDSPIKRGGDEEVGEVDRSPSAVAAQPGHRSVMALEDLSDACLTVIHTQGKELKPSCSCC